MNKKQIAIVLTYDADTTTKEAALKDAEEVVASLVFSHYEYFPYAGEIWVDDRYDDMNDWN